MLTIAPPLPPCLDDIRRTASAAQKNRAGHVDPHHPLKALDAHLIDALLRIDDTGVVDQPIEPPEMLVDRLEHRNDILRAADITLDRDRVAAHCLDLRGDRIGSRTVRGIVHRHVPALPGSEAANRSADTLGCRR